MFKINKILPLFLLLTVSAINTATAEEGLLLSPQQRQIMGLKLAQATAVNTYPSAKFSGISIIPLKTIRTLSSPLAGTIKALNVVHGIINKGQVIASLQSEYLIDMQSQLLTTIADLKVANETLNRIKQLRKGGASSLKKLQQAQSVATTQQINKDKQILSLKIAGMSQKAISTLLKNKQIQAPIIPIVAPTDGQLFGLKIRLNERVEKNQTLFSIGQLDPIIIIVRVPLKLAQKLSVGQKVKIDGLSQLGAIEHIDSEVMISTQSVDVHIQVDNKDHAIRIGQAFQLSFLMAKLKQPLYQISTKAISHFEGKTVVFSLQNEKIVPLAITVKNIANGQMYFYYQNKQKNNLSLIIKGSTAIKAAFEAAEE